MIAGARSVAAIRAGIEDIVLKAYLNVVSLLRYALRVGLIASNYQSLERVN